MNIRISRFLLLNIDTMDGAGQPIFRQYVARVTDHAFVSCHDIAHTLQQLGGAVGNMSQFQTADLLTHSLTVVDLDPANPQGPSDFLGSQSFYKSLFHYKNEESIEVLKTPATVTDQASLEAFCADFSGVTATLIIPAWGIDGQFALDVQQIGYVAEVTNAVAGLTTTLAEQWPAWETVTDVWHCVSDNAEDYFATDDSSNASFTYVNHSDSRFENIVGSLQPCATVSEPPTPVSDCCEDVQAMIDPVLKDKTIHPSIRSAVAAGVIRNTTGNSVPAVAHLGAKLMSAVFKASDPDGKQGTTRDNHGIEI